MNCVWVVVEETPHEQCVHLLNLGAPYWFKTREHALKFTTISSKLYPHLPALTPVTFPFFGLKVNKYDDPDFVQTCMPRECNNVIVVRQNSYYRAIQPYDYDEEEMDMVWNDTLSLYG